MDGSFHAWLEQGGPQGRLPPKAKFFEENGSRALGKKKRQKRNEEG